MFWLLVEQKCQQNLIGSNSIALVLESFAVISASFLHFFHFFILACPAYCVAVLVVAAAIGPLTTTKRGRTQNINCTHVKENESAQSALTAKKDELKLPKSCDTPQKKVGFGG
jgi:hypothetical protein